MKFILGSTDPDLVRGSVIDQGTKEKWRGEGFTICLGIIELVASGFSSQRI